MNADGPEASATRCEKQSDISLSIYNILIYIYYMQTIRKLHPVVHHLRLTAITCLEGTEGMGEKERKRHHGHHQHP